MKKHFKIKAFIVLLFGAGLILMTAGKSKIEKITDVIAGQAKGESEDSKPIERGLTVAMNTILNCKDTYIFGSCSVDESFLIWLAGKYGKDTLNNIAYDISLGRADQQIWKQYTGNTLNALWMKYCRDYGMSSYLTNDVIYVDDRTDDSSNNLTIDFIGDICFDREWYPMKNAVENNLTVSDCISPEIQAELKSADISVVNNEFTYGDGLEAVEGKAYTFQAPPESVTDLEVFGTDVVTLGNNHVYDYGAEGLLSTMDTLKNAGIKYIGAGKDKEEASRIQYVVASGYKIALVSATQVEKYSNYTKAATDDSPGVLKCLEPQEYCQLISKAKSQSDYVIVNVHWGIEGRIGFDEEETELAQAFIDAGADAVIGGHPHRLQGVEFIEKVPVAYSLGNFWFSSGSLYTTIAQVTIDSDGNLKLGFIPCIQSKGKTSLIMEEDERDNFYKYIADISSGIAIDENGMFYDKKDGADYTDKKYFSGQDYAGWPNRYDLDGNSIDTIGNIVD